MNSYGHFSLARILFLICFIVTFLSSCSSLDNSLSYIPERTLALNINFVDQLTNHTSSYSEHINSPMLSSIPCTRLEYKILSLGWKFDVNPFRVLASKVSAATSSPVASLTAIWLTVLSASGSIVYIRASTLDLLWFIFQPTGGSVSQKPLFPRVLTIWGIRKVPLIKGFEVRQVQNCYQSL